jgi:hypothetical protein
MEYNYMYPNFNLLEMDSKSLNNTQVNTDFYKLQQDYNSLRAVCLP